MTTGSSQPLRVGLNALYLVPNQVGGTETYARRLIAALAAARPDCRFVVFCAKEASTSLAAGSLPSNVAINRIGIPARVKPLRILVELLWLPLLARRAQVQLMHSLGTTGPLWSRCLRVVTVHDLIYHHYPATFTPFARRALELLVPASARRAQTVIADSQATKDDLVATYGIPVDRIEVVHLGMGAEHKTTATNADDLREKFELEEGSVVLTISAALEHKNLPRLLRAFSSANTAGAQLAVVGLRGREREALERTADALGIADRVHFTGWVSAAELEGLYALATCFVYPSLFEGFGLPPLEAMARGVPVACSNATSLPEVVGDAALVFDPRDEKAITAAIDRLLTDDALRADLITRGRERAAAFTWEKTAHETLAAYERALQAHRA